MPPKKTAQLTALFDEFDQQKLSENLNNKEEKRNGKRGKHLRRQNWNKVKPTRIWEEGIREAKTKRKEKKTTYY